MEVRDDRKYSKEHEWALESDDGTVRVGISAFAQDQLGDVVYVELPPVGTRVKQFQQMGEIESVKAVSELYSPVSGEILEVNDSVVRAPELVNNEPYDGGWLVRLRLDDATELARLMDASAYQTMTG